MPSPAHADSTFSIAQDVRHLIAQAEQGQALDVEFLAHAYDIQVAVDELLATRLRSDALTADLARRIGHFASTHASAQMYLRLSVTDMAPRLPDFDPSEVVVFDGVRGGIDFSTADVRFTNAGTVMTSVNITDLASYFEAGRKRVLVAYFGTDRNADALAHNHLAALLPALLIDARLPAREAAAILREMASGRQHPALGRMLLLLAERKALLAAPKSRGITAALLKVEARLMSVMTHIMRLPGAAPVLREMATRMTASIKTPPAPALIRASAPPLMAREVMSNLRYVAKHAPLSPPQRATLASAIRQIRGNAPQPALQAALPRTAAIVATITARPEMPYPVRAALSSITMAVRATHAPEPPPSRTAPTRPDIPSHTPQQKTTPLTRAPAIVARNDNLAAPLQRSIPQAMTVPVTAQVAMTPVIRATSAFRTNAATPLAQRSQVVIDLAAVASQPPPASPSADKPVQKHELPAADVQKNWADETIALLANPEPSEGPMKLRFNHICGPNCNHGGTGFTATEAPSAPNSAAVENRNLEVEFVAATPPSQNPASRRPRRTMRPS